MRGYSKEIKKMSLNATDASDPMNLMFGKVISASPLKILVDQRLLLTERQLILTSAVSERAVDITFSGYTEPDVTLGTPEEVNNTHRHQYVGRKSVTVNTGLNVGDKVMLLRVQGGQRFVVLDRVEVGD